MENRVHYGEYSLEHWIKLILKRNIELPEYQRSFVWDKSDVEKLIETFKNKRFVPPITIGAFKIENEDKNYIIDGQQRLTSIFLAYLGKFPDKSKMNIINSSEDFEAEDIEENNNNEGDSENDEEIENTDTSNENKDLRRVKWTFKDLTDKGKQKRKLLKI